MSSTSTLHPFNVSTAPAKKCSRSSIMAHPGDSDNAIEIQGFYWPRFFGGTVKSVPPSGKKGEKHAHKVLQVKHRIYREECAFKILDERPPITPLTELMQNVHPLLPEDASPNTSPFTGKPIISHKKLAKACLMLPGSPLRKKAHRIAYGETKVHKSGMSPTTAVGT